MHLKQSQTLFTIYHFITDTDFIAGNTCYDCALKTPAYQNVHRSSRVFLALKCLFRAKNHAQLRTGRNRRIISYKNLFKGIVRKAFHTWHLFWLGS